ncbi:unnamed protein product [Phytophthora fragariaefolia]|uniref:Unnamed protein product n=1 Tax=Phytophthora fragariaefolia TaxID=1490495 RepID=A0A9W7CYY6_9STRA|nr:unnamed protein product [Phytophthora fragariaefolia]
MLRIWGHRRAPATTNSIAHRAPGRHVHYVSRSHDALDTDAVNRYRELRVGVLGLGAIGTIFFTRLGLLAADSKTKEEVLSLKVDAFVKPVQFDHWLRSEELKFSLRGHNNDEEENLAFQVNSDRKVAAGIEAPGVRVCTLESAGCNEKLDVLLVAVKAYDSAGVIRELRTRNKHLLKDDALCVLLQNGLGELPQDEENDLHHFDDQWQFANGVTFVGGRVLGFGNVLTSGLDAGTTYLAPFAESGVNSSNSSGSEKQLQLRRDRNIKMKTVAQVFQAAGTEVISTTNEVDLLTFGTD